MKHQQKATLANAHASRVGHQFQADITQALASKPKANTGKMPDKGKQEHRVYDHRGKVPLSSIATVTRADAGRKYISAAFMRAFDTIHGRDTITRKGWITGDEIVTGSKRWPVTDDRIADTLKFLRSKDTQGLLNRFHTGYSNAVLAYEFEKWNLERKAVHALRKAKQWQDYKPHLFDAWMEKYKLVGVEQAKIKRV